MKAILFAAGLGSRLGQMTAHQPKALVKLGDKPLLEWVIRKIAGQGFQQIIINLHHFPLLIRQAVEQMQIPGAEISFSDESDLLLETGGGLKKAAWFFAGTHEPFLIHNSDVISQIDLNSMLGFHKSSGAGITVAVSQRSSHRSFLFNPQGRLCGWQNTQSKQQRIAIPLSEPKALSFSGIHIMNPEILSLLPEQSRFSLTDFYLEIAAQVPIMAFEHDPTIWFDMGKESTFDSLAHEILKNPRLYL